ncbi:MAG: hypothetical protein K0R09_1204 [Clostridiales bacterium]|nr:hypothetical protein [Clostridiales bacterium]
MKSMRRADRQMVREEATELLKRGEYGVLSTLDSLNQPYGVPLSYAYADNSIYIHCANEGTKLDNIKSNSNVCFTVVGNTNILPDKFTTEYESVIVFGKGIIVSGNDKAKGLREIIKKYSPEFIKEGEEYIERAMDKTTVVKIEIEDFSGKHRS